MEQKTSGFEMRKKGFENSEGVIHIDQKTLKKIQHVLLDMLKEVIQVFQKYDIQYSMSGGSVLGAIRHHGFIPWDDDIDLNMPRKDFEALKKVFDKELGERYELFAPELGKHHGMMLAQIKKKGTVYRGYNELSKEHCGFCIDIFVMENTYDTKLRRAWQGMWTLAYGYFVTCRKTYEDMPYLERYLQGNPAFRKSFVKKARIGKWLPVRSLDRLTAKAMRVYAQCRNDHSEYVSIPSGRNHFFKELYKRSDVCTFITTDFEDMKVNVPKNYDTYMTMLYGPDYMELPPEEKREIHPLMELDFGEE